MSHAERTLSTDEGLPGSRVKKNLVAASKLEHCDQLLEQTTSILVIFSSFPVELKWREGPIFPQGPSVLGSTQRINSEEHLLDVPRKGMRAVDYQIA
ncbi:MAG: hypothetical protein WD894_26955 [Pirellulales bacterium]